MIAFAFSALLVYTLTAIFSTHMGWKKNKHHPPNGK
jgi:hypothetical protein